MQATMNSNALAPSPRLQFARRGYMVRSEKRRRPDPQRGPEQGGGRPPRKRRNSAGFFYKLLTVLLLLVLWPIGLILLWRRKLRWSVLTKVFTTVISLMACILLIGSALTVQIDNPRFTAAQKTVNGFLGEAADAVVDFSITLGRRVDLSLEAVDQLNFLYREQSLTRMADFIDQGVALAQVARENVSEFVANLSPQPESTEAPEDEADETDLPGGDVEAEPTDAAEEAADEEATTEAEPEDEAEDAPEAAPTSVPAAEITVVAADEELPVYIPRATPDPETGTAIAGGILSRAGTLDEGALPDPTPEPTPEAYSFAVKPAADAIVFFNIGSGKYYHMTNVCGSMKNADTHTFAETAENIHKPCERCTPPDKTLLEETYIVWLDESETAHLSDGCAAFEGQWNIVSAQAANEAGYAGCAACDADRYLEALSNGLDVTLEPYRPAPAEEEEPEVTEEPAA